MPGRIHRIVTLLEREKSAFAVSRLIMLSGVSVRNYDASSPDDPEAMTKIRVALRQLLTEDELESFERSILAG